MTKNWGKGWQVGVNKAIYQHDKAMQRAAEILEAECGTKHDVGSHDLCPRCKLAIEIQIDRDERRKEYP